MITLLLFFTAWFILGGAGFRPPYRDPNEPGNPRPGEAPATRLTRWRTNRAESDQTGWDGDMIDKIKVMEASVRKWERIIEGEGSDGGVLDCPPCRIFYMLICTGCPIADYTGKKFCKGSPYGPWFHHHNDVHQKLKRKVYCPECLRLATNMRDFMKEIVAHMKAEKAKAEKGVPARDTGDLPAETDETAS